NVLANVPRPLASLNAQSVAVRRHRNAATYTSRSATP
ncbi:MAG: hypothetical protein ACI8W7_003252, partial [Gammaproteobacteria bacterium]